MNKYEIIKRKLFYCKRIPNCTNPKEPSMFPCPIINMGRLPTKNKSTLELTRLNVTQL